MSAFHLSIYRSKIFSTAFPALETFISSFIESSISIPLPLSTLIPKGRSSIKIIDLFSSKMKWKIFSEESCNLEAKLSQKLVRKYRCNLRFSESPPISMSHASTEFGGRIKSEGWEARGKSRRGRKSSKSWSDSGPRCAWRRNSRWPFCHSPECSSATLREPI